MSPSPQFEQAMGFHRAGQLDQAETLYRKVLDADPGDLAARQMLCVLRVDQGRHAEALAECDAVLAIQPGAVQAQMQKGFALVALGRLENALAHYDSILAGKPRFPAALHFRGEVLLHLGRPEEALASFDRALKLDGTLAQTWVARGSALKQLRRPPQEAIASYDRALSIKPDYAETWLTRAVSLENLGRDADALASYNRALAAKPDYTLAHNNRSLLLIRLRRFNDAAGAFREAQQHIPDWPYALGGLATAVLNACDWDAVQALRPVIEDHVRNGTALVPPGALLGFSDDPALLQACTTPFSLDMLAPLPPPLWRGEVFRNPKIRIAYVSSDFHEHATAHLIAELFERHDRTQFEIWGLGFDADDGSALRQRLVASFDRFVDIASQSDEQAAEFLHDSRIDIAVDLKGLTMNSRPRIFAHRPAPIQVNYLGHPGTMGVDFYDYILGDTIVLPMDQQPFYSEQIVQLPDCYQPNDATRRFDRPAPSRAQAGLPERGLVFCCFNNSWKITRPVFEIWMRLLQAVPGSVLWLLDDNPDAAAHLRQAAGGLAHRLIFAPRLEISWHMARHRLADLFLDTLPYNAHTTASDALRLGVPLITCTGHAFQARVATSLLHAIGLPELAVDTLEDYEQLALALAQNPERLSALRQRLEANRTTTPLFDTPRYAKAIESAYRQMWQTWQQNEPPRGFRVGS